MKQYILVDPNDPDNPPQEFDDPLQALAARIKADEYYKKSPKYEYGWAETILYERWPQ